MGITKKKIIYIEHMMNTIAKAVGANSSALYLREPGSDVLNSRVATGYQMALMKAGTRYELRGPGITACSPLASSPRSF